MEKFLIKKESECFDVDMLLYYTQTGCGGYLGFFVCFYIVII